MVSKRIPGQNQTIRLWERICSTVFLLEMYCQVKNTRGICVNVTLDDGALEIVRILKTTQRQDGLDAHIGELVAQSLQHALVSSAAHGT